MIAHRTSVIAIVILVFAGYANALFNGFAGDDSVLLVKNSFYRSWDNLPRLFSSDYTFEFRQTFLGRRSDLGSGSVSYRPVDNLTYFVDYAVWKLNAFGFHLTNVLIHLANVLLLYFLLVRFDLNRSAALLAALLFGLHPIQSEAVCAIGYRADPLACFFILLAMHAWIIFSKTGRSVFYAAALAAYFFGVFSKESAVAFPVMVFVYQRLFGKGRYARQAGLWAVCFFYLYAYFVLFPSKASSQLPVGDWPSHALLCVRIFVEYARAFFLPWDVRLLPTLYAPEAGNASLEVLTMIGTATAVFFIFIYGRRHKVFAFFALWFLIFYAPVSNLIALPNPMAFRFMYLPSVGFIVGLALVLDALLSAAWIRNISKNLPLILKASVIILCLTLTVLLNGLWRNNAMVAMSWVKHYPQSWKANLILGQLNLAKANYKEAAEFFLRSVHKGARARDVQVDYYLGLCYLNMEQLDRALLHFNLALAAYPQFQEAAFGVEEVQRRKKEGAAGP